MVKHHLESYNDFVKNKIGIIVKQFNPLSIYHSYNEEENNYRYEIMIEFIDVHFNKFFMKMMEVQRQCILRKLRIAESVIFCCCKY